MASHTENFLKHSSCAKHFYDLREEEISFREKNGMSMNTSFFGRCDIVRYNEAVAAQIYTMMGMGLTLERADYFVFDKNCVRIDGEWIYY